MYVVRIEQDLTVVELTVYKRKKMQSSVISSSDALLAAMKRPELNDGG
jgi:hypothetical protein